MILITLIPKSVAIGKIIRLSAGINKKKKKIVQNNLGDCLHLHLLLRVQDPTFPGTD